MATATLKKTDMRMSMRADPKELAAQYRLAVQPRKRSVNVIKRSRATRKASKAGAVSGSASSEAHRKSSITTTTTTPTTAAAEEEGESQAAAAGGGATPGGSEATTGGAEGGGGGGDEGGGGGECEAATYIQTSSWGKMEDFNDEEYTFDEEEEEDLPEPKEEPMCQKKYRAICKLLRIHPIKHFLRSLVTERTAVKNQTLSKDDVKACVIALLHTDTIDSIWFDDNGLGAHGATRITDILPRKSDLTELKITNNRLCSEGARIVCEALKHNTRLRRLDLSGNDFQDDDAEVFKNLMEENLALRCLNLSHNNFRERGGQILAAGLATNRTLQKLDLGWNHIRMAGAMAIGKSIKENGDLEELNLAWNGFHLRGCMALGDALSHNTCLTRLDLTSNRVSELALAQLMRGLKKNTTLEKLLLPMNPLSPHAAYRILEFVDTNEELALTLIDLGTTCVYEEFETYLEELKTRRDIEVLRGPTLRTGLKFEDPLADDGDGEWHENPLIILMEYCRLQNLRVIDMFNSLDTDGSKSLSYDEFKDGLRKVGIPLSEESLERLMMMLDQDGDGEIDFGELIDGQKHYKEQLRAAMAETGGTMDATIMGKVGMRIKEKFNKNYLMRKF